MKFSVLALCLYISSFALAIPAYSANSLGIGIGWNSATKTELIYLVNLETGNVVKLGSIPNLQWLSLGAIDVDTKSGAIVLLGNTDASAEGKIYITDPFKQLSLEYSLPEIESFTYQDIFTNPVDGRLYVLGYSNSDNQNKIYSVSLNALQSGESKSQATLSLVGSITMNAYLAGSPNVGSDGLLHLLAAVEDSAIDDHVTFNLSTAEVVSYPANGSGLQNLVLCSSSENTAPVVLGYDSIADENFYSSLSTDGSLNRLNQTSDILGWSAASQSCFKDIIYLVGSTNSLPDSNSLFRIPLSGSAVESVVIDNEEIFIVAPISTEVAQLFSSSSPAHKLSTLALKSKITKLSPSKVKACAKKSSALKKAKTPRATVKAARKLIVMNGKCG